MAQQRCKKIDSRAAGDVIFGVGVADVVAEVEGDVGIGQTVDIGGPGGVGKLVHVGRSATINGIRGGTT